MVADTGGTLVTRNGTGDFVGIRTDAVGLRITDADPTTETTSALFQHDLFHQMDTLITFGATDYNEPSELNDESRATARAAGLSIAEVDRDISGAPRTDVGSGTGYSTGAYELDD
jgi:hypothetical protein